MNGREARGLTGLLLIDKPKGLTSHEVVVRLRRLSGQKKIGHTGTLDPLATGLMAVLWGTATRLEPYLNRLGKTYQGRLELGLVTDTDDVAGQILNRHSGPWPAKDAVWLALKAEEGPTEQVPPAFSAIKVAGRRAYQAARAGVSLNLPPRKVTAFQLELLRYEPPALDFTAAVSSGYYIRSLARDLGRSLGVGGAALTELRRTKVGPWSVEQAKTLEDVSGWTENQWRNGLQPPSEALPDWPALILAEIASTRLFTQGRRLPASGPMGRYKIMDAQGRLIGLGQIETAPKGAAVPPQEPFLRPLRVFPLSQPQTGKENSCP